MNNNDSKKRKSGFNPNRTCYLTADGQEGMLLERGDVVRVAGLPAAVQFMGEGTCFFERLRSRGFVLQGAPGGLSGGRA